MLDKGSARVAQRNEIPDDKPPRGMALSGHSASTSIVVLANRSDALITEF
jgi:hypothetical protein